MERVVLLRLRAGRRVLGRLAPARPLPQPPGRLVDGLDRAPRRAPASARSTTAPRCRPATASSRGVIGPDDTADRGSRSTSVRPLEEFRLAASPPAPSSTLRRRLHVGRADAVPRHALDLDLTWTTDGVPYHYDVTTRYEIPCTVPAPSRSTARRSRSTARASATTPGACGTGGPSAGAGARCGSTTAPGSTWPTSGCPGMPMFFGYVQQPEHGGAPGHVAVGHRGPRAARFPIQGPHRPHRRGPTRSGTDLCVGLDVTPVAFGPVLLRNDDGRTSRFPRAMSTAGPTTAAPAPAGSSGTSPTPPLTPRRCCPRPPEPRSTDSQHR